MVAMNSQRAFAPVPRKHPYEKTTTATLLFCRAGSTALMVRVQQAKAPALLQKSADDKKTRLGGRPESVVLLGVWQGILQGV